MKKALALLLALVMVLPLAACGGGNNTTDTIGASAETTASENVAVSEHEEDTEPQVFHLNETIQAGNYELSIHDVRVEKNVRIGFSTGAKQFRSENGYFVCVTYSFKNIGKSDILANRGVFTLNYADGYQFYCDSSLYLHGPYSDLYEHGGTQEASTILKTLGDEVYFLEAFDVPNQVVEDTDSPLFLTLNAALLDTTANTQYNIRPLDEIQKQALYDEANDLWESKNYKQAVSRLDEIGDYKDAVELREKIFQEYCLRVGTYYDDTKEYINAVADTLETVSGEELKEAIVGEWYLSLEGDAPMTFNSDGTISDPNGKYASWSVDGDILSIVTNSGTDFTSTAKRLSDRGFLLFYKNKQFFEDGEFFKGMCAVH